MRWQFLVRSVGWCNKNMSLFQTLTSTDQSKKKMVYFLWIKVILLIVTKVRKLIPKSNNTTTTTTTNDNRTTAAATAAVTARAQVWQTFVGNSRRTWSKTDGLWPAQILLGQPALCSLVVIAVVAVARSGKYHGAVFLPTQSTTQEGIISPILFNILVDAVHVARKWCANVMDDMTFANAGLDGKAVGTTSSLFYDNDGAVGSLDPNWLQDAKQHLYDLIRNCVDLKPNTKKTAVVICHPGSIIRGPLLDAGYN